MYAHARSHTYLNPCEIIIYSSALILAFWTYLYRNPSIERFFVPDAMTTKGAKKDIGNKKLLAVNLKVSGKVHRVSTMSAAQPREKWRACCGWRLTGAIAKTMFYKRMPTRDLCRKCFPKSCSTSPRIELDDIIENPDY